MKGKSCIKELFTDATTVEKLPYKILKNRKIK